MVNRDAEKFVQERIDNTQTCQAETLVFPSPKRQYTPSTVKHEHGSRFTSTDVCVGDVSAPRKLLKNQ